MHDCLGYHAVSQWHRRAHEKHRQCLCGAITFVLSEGPVGTRACWCRTCQYLCSGNASFSVFFRQRALSVFGEPAEFLSLSDAGNLIRRRFCPQCGTPLFADAPIEPEYLIVRLGALDDRQICNPASIVWTASAPSWAWFDHDKPSFPGQPS
ncbi:GFA family protein [Brevundimonas sp. S1H14]|uniref:GFA family protein n=1 Tax=Brevundimonas sp. S1H14 TaxID=3078084 RepID=UPI0039E98EC0